MSTFTLRMSTDSAAFSTIAEQEIARILIRTAETVAHGSQAGRLVDINGEVVGEYRLIVHDPDDTPEDPEAMPTWRELLHPFNGTVTTKGWRISLRDDRAVLEEQVAAVSGGAQPVATPDIHWMVYGSAPADELAPPLNPKARAAYDALFDYAMAELQQAMAALPALRDVLGLPAEADDDHADDAKRWRPVSSQEVTEP